MSERFDLLGELLSIDSPSGDEHLMADWLSSWLEQHTSDAVVIRLRDCLVVTKGAPKVGIFAHMDTCGFTVGYDSHKLIPIGSPQFEADVDVRAIGSNRSALGQLKQLGTKGEGWVVEYLEPTPGDRLIFAVSPVIKGDRIQSPHLDNRAGLWAALQALQQCEDVCVCFTTGEETGGSGAIICARYIYEKLGITQALISDITWHTQHIRCGRGVAISRRDRWVPSQRFVERVTSLAQRSEIAFQIEIESDGGSDGGGIERSGCPIDWVFIGAPEERPHSATESLNLNDLDAMAQMLTYLIRCLTAQSCGHVIEHNLLRGIV